MERKSSVTKAYVVDSAPTGRRPQGIVVLTRFGRLLRGSPAAVDRLRGAIEQRFGGHIRGEEMRDSRRTAGRRVKADVVTRQRGDRAEERVAGRESGRQWLRNSARGNNALVQNSMRLRPRCLAV